MRDIDSGEKELQKGEMSETVFAKKGKKPKNQMGVSSAFHNPA